MLPASAWPAWWRSAAPPRARAAIAAALVAVTAPFAYLRAPFAWREVSFAVGNATLNQQLQAGVDEAGGPSIAERGKVHVNRGFVPHMAWEMKLPIAPCSARARRTGSCSPRATATPGRPVPIVFGSKVK